MKTVLMVVLAIASLILIASILLQSGNSAGLSGSIGGGAEQLFGKRRARAMKPFFPRLPQLRQLSLSFFLWCW